MSTRSVWSRVLVLSFALVITSVFTFAAIGGTYSSLFSAGSTSAESAPIPSSPESSAVAGTVICDTAGPIEVESTGGTTTPTPYGTLKLAFDAVIAGTHTGSINIEVCGNTNETVTAALTASGVGSASYTDVTIRPVGGARVIEGSIVGAIIRLQGADNVTIDGREGGAGTARDLTVRNNNASAATAAIWLSSVAAGNGAASNVIRNLEIAGGADQQGSANATMGIIQSGTTISVTSADGNDNDNNQFIFNRIVRVRYGIVSRGVTTNNNLNAVVTDNTIGPVAFGPDQIGKAGIYMQSDTGALVSRNTVQNVGVLIANAAAGADRIGIAIGNENWDVVNSTTITSGDYTVTKNVVHDIVEEKTFSAVGIRLGTTRSGVATNNLIANNFIYNVRANGTSGDQVCGIGYAAGHTDRIVYNSISITGDQDPGASAASTTYGNAIRVSTANAANNVNLTLMNNSVYLDASSSSTAANRYYAITLPSTAYVFGTGGLNYNNYYIVPTNTQLQTGGLGVNTTSAITAQFATLANWQAALTAPQDANSIQADPVHFSNTSDLHLQSVSPNINAGTTIAGIAEDIDAQVRPNGANPDIGADEFYAGPGSVQMSSSTYSATETAGMITVTVTRSGGANGAASVDYATGGGTATGGGACGGSVDYVTTSGTLTWADLEVTPKTFNVPICADGTLESPETFNITLSNPVTVTLGTPSAAVATILDAGTVFSGPVSVGSGEAATSLTNPGGLFDAINNGSVTGNITINITSDLTGESGSIPLNQVAGGFSVLIKPSGSARSITSTISAVSVIKLNEADNVTIDGSLSGGSDRSLTITNTSLSASTAVIWLGGGVNGAQNNTVKNLELAGGFDQTTGSVFNFAIIASSNAAILTGGTDLDNNTYTNNYIRKVSVGIISIGGLASNMNQNNVISNNLIGPAAFGSDQISTLGILAFNENGMNIVGNEIRMIGDLATTGGSSGRDHTGISLCTGNATWSATSSTAPVGNMTNATVARNRIHDIIERATFSAAGIVENCPKAAATTNTFANNFIYNVQANGTSGDQAVGIGIWQGNGDSFVFNSINMTGDLDPGASTSSTTGSTGFFIGNSTAANVPVNVTVKDNISATDVTSNTATVLHAAITIPAAFVWGTGGSDFNDWFANPSSTQTRVGAVGTTFHPTLAAWQTATSQDANSKSVDPLFVSASDLHLQSGSTLINMGTAIAGVTTDIDGQTRDATPDIGADEFVVLVPGTLAFSSATYTVGEAGPTVTLTVNRTGGTDGAVTVDYSLGGGSATGGAACGGSVDYVNAGGTVSFANGEASKTFDVPICSDSVFEGDETFDATLSNATGGATIGSPNPATVTITEDKGQPTVQFSSSTYMTTEALNPEGGTGATITVTLSGPSQSAASVDYATVAGGTATGGASCTAGVDYINASGTLNFVAGDVSETFFVTTCPDTDDEPDETVNLALSNPVGTTLGTPNTAVLTINDNDVPAGGPVTVTATAGTPGPTNYPTLKDAIDAINAGTHQGDITVSIVTSTTETATSVLNSSGAGTALYTSIVIRPVNDSVTVAGPSAQGRGLIELNGADNVTIDGDNPNTGGTNRNLTIQNNAVNTTTFTSVIRIALNITTVTSADNVSIRNLNVVGSATGRNIATGVTTDSQNNTYGILATGNASGATTAPTAISSLTTVIAAGATASNLVISNNSFATAARAVSIQGSAVSVFPGLMIQSNEIGNPTAAALDQIYVRGISAQGSSNGIIAGNTVYVEGFVGSSGASATVGIDVGGISANGTFTIDRNKVNRVRNNNTGTWATYGINLGGSSNHVVQNNFVSDILNNQVAGTGAFNTTFGAIGIRVGSGTGHDVYHNSVHLYGAVPGTVSTNLTAAFGIAATGQTGVDVRNNIFSNQVSGGNPTGTRHVAVFLPSGATVAMNLTINNNAYYAGTSSFSRLAQVGVTFGTGEYQAADFDPTATTPASNFRAYTSTLSAAGTNDNASFATTAPPPFTSNTDLHIPAGTATRLESGGAPVGVTTDIDLETRNAATPDIGADEFAGNPVPANDIGAVAFVTPANGSTIPTGSLTPQATFTNNGTATQTNVTVRFRIFDSMMVEIYNQTATIASIAPLQNVVVSFPPTSIANAGAYTMQASAELAGDQNPANDTINGSFNTVVPFSGTVNVGTGETFTSLTNPGGLFQAINTAGVSGNLVINITSDLTGETGTVLLNEFASPHTVTIKPSGAARTISGTTNATSGLIGFDSADRVTIDGSLSGGTDRSLTVSNLITTNAGGGIYFASGTNGAQNNTVKNVNVWGGGATTGSLLGITFAANAFGAVGVDLDNNRIENNDIRGAFYGIAILGASPANQNTGTVITKNVMPATGPAGIGRIGIYVIHDNGAQITENNIASVSSGAAADCIGLAIGNQNMTLTAPVPADVTNALIARNYVGVVNNTATNSSVGIVLASGTTGTNTVVNNMVSGVIGNSDLTDFVAGIYVIPRAGSTQNVYHNSVSMTGDRGATANMTPSYALAISADQPINVVNNILTNSQTRTGAGGGGESYSIAFDGPAANANLMSNFNDLFVAGPLGRFGITGDLTTPAQTTTAGTGTNRTTLADWQTAASEDANSLSVDPLFLSTSNLHLQVTSPMRNAGTTGTGVTTDIDGETRDAMPDIGADELPALGMPGVLQFSAPTYVVGEGGTVATITVTRTGGTDGTVTVQYATVPGGSATGGATCGAGVDYQNTSGTLTFINGDDSETFDVPICNDSMDEPDETVNLALTNATGGATIGTQSTAVLTITDDDATPGSLSINDVRMFEGDSGKVVMIFTVSYIGPPVPVSVQYATANGTAIAGVDYQSASGTLFFNTQPPVANGIPTQTQNVIVTIIPELVKEANETFFVNLSNPTGATISDGQGVGIIIDEDRAYVSDFDRDLRADVTVFRPSDGRWYELQSTNDTPKIVAFGTSGDIPVPGDYDADGETDYAVWRPSTATWWRLLSAGKTQQTTVFGQTGDKPVQGDYDGDAKTDLAVYRPSTGTWSILRSSDGATITVAFGISTDRPVQGDYDGDHKTDIAVYRDGTWYILRSSDGGVLISNWGIASDRPVSGDFDGDGKFDLAIYRDGAWWVMNSLTGTTSVVAWGLATDIPVPADYDADGTTDRAVFRPSSGDWYIMRSSDNTTTGLHWGTNGDIPIPAAYLPQ